MDARAGWNRDSRPTPEQGRQWMASAPALATLLLVFLGAVALAFAGVLALGIWLWAT